MTLRLSGHLRRGALLCAFLFLAACQSELYSGLPERDVNEMMSVLLSGGIQAEKVAVDETFAIQVASSDVQRALEILNANGLPRGERESIGAVFARSGIVSSPFEERVRYVYALSEEVARTLQEIDGVLVARVHIVMPEAPALGEVAAPSSAAVFIRTREGYDLEYLTPQIRRLVANSIEGLSFDAVTVILVEARPPSIDPERAEATLRAVLPGVQVHMSSVGLFWSWFGGLIALLIASLAGLGWLGFARFSSARRLAQPEEQTE
ncbi:MAG: type III secretion inner membrane ring lipoprotein SctJ [Rhodobacteraceae bacterium]|nr:type III secretion inner membrane ring lipoprotein SctJ [Paracoccaceae bacterium]